MLKIVSAIISCFLIITISVPLSAYRLPACSISDEERERPAEEILSGYKADLAQLSQSVSLARLDEYSLNPKIRLTSKERKATSVYEVINTRIEFWTRVSRLKNSLVALHGVSPPDDAVTEADAIAKDVIETLYALSQKWRIGSSAIFSNMLINMGLREKGFCYHYVASLRRALMKRDWRQFDIRWGAAWENTYRENNALVITATGRPFEEGLAIDAWRTAGRPFWTSVKNDRFPWVEEKDVEMKYEIE
jgi:hypothetical protein